MTKYEDFKEMIEEFVTEHFTITGCKMCHETGNGEIVPDDYKGSYEKAMKELFGGVSKFFEEE